MKNKTSLFKIRDRKPKLNSTLAFAVYHAALLCGLLVVLLSGRLSVTTDFMSLLPTYGVSESVAKAEKMFAAKQNANATILIGHPDFDTAKTYAERMYRELTASDIFTELTFSAPNAAGADTGDANADGFSELLAAHRYQLIPENTAETILQNPEAFQAESLASIFSPMAFLSLENLDTDPFFIDNIILGDFLQKLSGTTPVMPKDGVLATEHTGTWYVMLRGVFSEKTLDISKTSGGIDRIYEIGDALRRETAELSVSYSGFPFHSYESASNAQREITLITTISIALIVLMFLALLRNIHVIGLFLAGTFLSLFSAFAAAAIFFPALHILTLIFGTSLIGTSIDYTIHYYLAYAKRSAGDGGKEVAKKLSKNLAVSLASTVLCYLLIVFSPYGILRQVAVFCAAGLASSFLTATGLFPAIIRPSMVAKNALAWKLPEEKKHRSFLLPLLAVSLAAFAFVAGNLQVKNNVLNLYQMSERLLESEKTTGSVLGFTSFTYAIIEGENEIDAREKEADFARAIQPILEKDGVGNYLSVSTFIPAPSAQQKSLEAARQLLPLLESQCDALGISPDAARKAMEAQPAPLTLSGFSGGPGIAGQAEAALRQLVPGEIDGKYYLAALVFGNANSEAIKDTASGHPGVTFFQKSKDVNEQLDALTVILLQIFAAAFIIIFFLLLAVFKKKGLRLALSPVIIITAVLATAGALGLQIDFFFAVGLLLVMGLGLDYMVFAGNSEKKPMLAISLSYATTALSFGTLMFSSFRPVHIFGTTVFIGITAAFFTALCAGNKKTSGKGDDISFDSGYTECK